MKKITDNRWYEPLPIKEKDYGKSVIIGIIMFLFLILIYLCSCKISIIFCKKDKKG